MDIRHVAVLGAGTMGAGIAQVSATAGYETSLFDVDPGQLEESLQRIERNLARSVEKGRIKAQTRVAALARLRGGGDLRDAVGAADLVVEAVPENPELKARIFSELEAHAPSHAILASNTSSIPISQIARAVADPGRVVGMHFFNPVPAMALLELVRGDQTRDEVIAAATSVGIKMGKTPIIVRDSPGFASSRLGIALGLEAMRMVEEEVATPADIDRAMELGYRHPMGPLRLTDLVGLDVRLAIAENLHRELGSDTFRPPEILRRLVREGRLGKKSGEGFHRWD